MDCGPGFDKLGVDPLDELSALFIWVDGNNPVVRDPVFPEEVQETDGSALWRGKFRWVVPGSCLREDDTHDPHWTQANHGYVQRFGGRTGWSPSQTGFKS